MLYRFGEFELDPDAYRLTRAGEPVVIEPRVLELLAHLLANRERVVGHEELLREVWEGRVVTHAVLTRAVHAARAALGDSSSSSEWVETVHGRGYRFSGQVETSRDPSATAVEPAARVRRSPSPRRWLAVAGLVVALAVAFGWWARGGREALAAGQAVALLPFVNATGDDSLEWVELGLMDLVAIRLAREHGLDVVPTTQTLSALESLGIERRDRPADSDFERLRRGLGAPVLLSSVVARDVGLYRLEMTVHGDDAGTFSRVMTGGDLFVVAQSLSDALGGRVARASTGLYGTAEAGARDALATGIHQLLSGNPTEARLRFERALDLDPELTEARYRLGIALSQLGVWGEAEAAGEAVLAEATASGDPYLEALAERLLGDVAQLRGDYEDAEARYQRAVDRFTTIDDSRGRALTLTSLATIGLQQHDWPKARRWSLEALESCRQIGYTEGVAATEHTLGVLAGRSGRLAEADDHFTRALELSREAGNRRGEARALHNLGSNAQNRGHWDRAEELHRQALRLRREQRDPVATAGSLVNLAVTGVWRGTLTAADADAEEARHVFVELGNPRGEAMAWTVQAYAALGRRDFAAARDRMERARSIWLELGVEPRVAQALMTLAEIADEAGDAVTAARLAEEAHAAVVDTGDRNLMAYSLRVRARAAAVGGRERAAEALFREALAVAREVGNEGIESSIATDLAELLLDRARAAEAAPLVELLVERLPQSGPVTLLAARLAIERGNTEAGCARARRARELAHELWDADGEAVLAACPPFSGPDA